MELMKGNAVKKTIIGAILVCAITMPALSSTVDLNSLTVYAGGGISMGNGSTIDGAIAAGASVSAGQQVTLKDIYTQTTVYLGQNATVSGNVLANQSANADKYLNLVGNWSGRSVWLGKGAQVTGDIYARTSSISIDRDGNIVGNIDGNGSIWLDRDTSVTGYVSPGIGQSLSYGSGVSIGGSTDAGYVDVPTFELPSIGDTPSHGSAGSEGIWRGNNSSLTLDAGAYNYVSFGRDSTLNLSAGEYTMSSFWMDRGGVVNINTSAGDVVLNVLGSFGTGKETTFATTGGGQLYINVFNNSMYLDSDVSLDAQIRIYGGNFGAGNNMELDGSIWATGCVTMGNDAYLNGQPVPEPTTLAMLGLGGSLIIIRRRSANRVI